ncbi:MAG: Na+/H+ antiporter subunit D [Chloroflexota bacterium]
MNLKDQLRLVRRVLSLVGAVAGLVAAVGLLNSVMQHGIQSTQIGEWSAPYGITIVSDLFSAIMVLLTAAMGLVVVVYSLACMDAKREEFGYFPLLHFLLMGISGAFLTGDIFNLYVWFEVLLISSFVLLALGGDRAQIEGTLKYVALNLLSSSFFLVAIGLLYGLVGTLNMADLSVQLKGFEPQGVVITLSTLFMVAFGIKAALFPVFFWLPASYHTPPAAVSAIFAGLLTKVGIYALIRVFTLLFVQDTGYTHTIILVVAGLTMVVGILGAVAQYDFRRILSFNLVSHVGYIVMGLGLFSPLALAGSIFYIIHDVVVKTNLFLVSGVIYRITGSYSIRKMGGLYLSRPFVAILFFVPAMSLSGIPPFSGFWPKLALLRAGLQAEQYWIVFAALFASLFTLYTMTRIWAEIFWKDIPDDDLEASASLETEPQNWLVSLIPVVSLVLLVIIIGIAADPIFDVAQQAAEQLLNPDDYIKTVLGDKA